ncbi:MAG: dCTP deaminase [SAR202 cluster bacterium]|nr:dCTP deaminase [SAR202 cluster bacterium]
MVLSDRDIRNELKAGRIVVDPLAEGAVQPASVDLRLGRKFRVFQHHREGYIDVKLEMADLTELVEIDEEKPFFLHPSEFALGVTLEKVCLPADIVGRLDGKSSLGRLGLVVHSTAGFVDPGWRGYLTLELSNLSPLPITLYCGMKVSQISFMRLTSPAEQPYGAQGLGSKYQGQDEPAASRFFLNYKRSRR